MARRDDGILDVLAELPWWIGVIITGIVYLVMRYALPGFLSNGGSMSAALADMPRMLALPVAGVMLLAPGISALRSLRARIREGGQRPTSSTATRPSGSPQRPSPSGASRPCPRCGGELVIRRASRGANAGSNFWGCSGFPTCRYTEDVAK